MKKQALNFISIKRNYLFMLLFFFVLSPAGAFAQVVPDTTLMNNRMDSLSISGKINYPPGSGHFIYYVINHDTTSQTVDVQITSVDSLHFNFSIVDTAFLSVPEWGSVNNSTYTKTVNVNTLHTGTNYLMFCMYVASSGSTSADLYSTFK